MSLGGYFDDIVQGTPWGTSDAQTAAGNAATDQLAQMNAAKLANGTWTQAQFNQAQNDLLTQNQADAATMALALADATVAQSNGQDPTHVNLTGEIGGAAAQSIGNTLSKWTTNPLGSLFGAVPWQLWLIGGAFAFVYLGGLKVFRDLLKK